MYKLIPFGSLSFIQMADVELSMVWKKQSAFLLRRAVTKKNFDDLKEAVYWCGEKGHAVFSSFDANEADIEQIAKWITNNTSRGFVFNYETKEFCDSFLERRDYSWVSKICHILNPQYNPPML